MPQTDPTSLDAPVPAAPTPVDIDRVMDCVRSLGLRFFLDDEGDLAPDDDLTVEIPVRVARAEGDAPAEDGATSTGATRVDADTPKTRLPQRES